MANAFDVNMRIIASGPHNLNPVVRAIRSQVASVPITLTPTLSGNGVQNAMASAKNLHAALNATTVAARTTGAAFSGINFNPGVVAQVGALNTHISKTKGSLTSLQNSLGVTTSFAENLGRSIGDSARRFGAFLVVAKAVDAISSSFAEGVRKAIDFQHEMVRLGQIGGSTAQQVSSVSQEISNLATTLGTSSADLSKVSVTLRQAGMGADEVREALSALAKTTLAPTFDSIQNTTEGIIAMRQQFGVSAKDIESHLGSINTVAAAYAVESNDLVTAIRKTGGAFRAAAGDSVGARESFSQLLAMFTSVRSTTREGSEEIATGLRTIFGRLQSNRVSDSLKNMGIDLRRATGEVDEFGNSVSGQFVGAYEAISRLSKATKGLSTSDPRFAEIAQQIGGYRQISRVIPLLQQFSLTQKAYAVAQAGSNSLTNDASKAQEAFAVRLVKVQEKFYDLVRTIGDNKGLKQFVDMMMKGADVAIRVAKTLEPLIPLMGVLALKNTIGASAAIAKGATQAVQAFPGAITNMARRRPTGFASGGVVPGTGSGDIVPATLPANSFVIRKSSAQKIGYNRLAQLGSTGYATGGSTNNQNVMLEPREWVFTPQEASRIGYGKLRQLNQNPSGYSSGGRVELKRFLKTVGLENLPVHKLIGRFYNDKQDRGFSDFPDRIRNNYEDSMPNTLGYYRLPRRGKGVDKRAAVAIRWNPTKSSKSYVMGHELLGHAIDTYAFDKDGRGNQRDEDGIYIPGPYVGVKSRAYPMIRGASYVRGTPQNEIAKASLRDWKSIGNDKGYGKQSYVSEGFAHGVGTYFDLLANQAGGDKNKLADMHLESSQRRIVDAVGEHYPGEINRLFGAGTMKGYANGGMVTYPPKVAAQIGYANLARINRDPNSLLKRAPAGYAKGGPIRKIAQRSDPSFLNSWTMFHGTNVDDLTGEAIDTNKTSFRNYAGPGFYASISKKVAEGYALNEHEGGSPTIYGFHPNVGKILDMDEPLGEEGYNHLSNMADRVYGAMGRPNEARLIKGLGYQRKLPSDVHVRSDRQNNMRRPNYWTAKDIITPTVADLTRFGHSSNDPTPHLEYIKSLRESGYDAIAHTDPDFANTSVNFLDPNDNVSRVGRSGQLRNFGVRERLKYAKGGLLRNVMNTGQQLAGTATAKIFNNTDAAYGVGTKPFVAMLVAELGVAGAKKLMGKVRPETKGFARGGEVFGNTNRDAVKKLSTLTPDGSGDPYRGSRSRMTKAMMLKMARSSHGPDIANMIPDGSSLLGYGVEATAVRAPSGNVHRIAYNPTDGYNSRVDHPLMLQALNTRKFEGSPYSIEELPYAKPLEEVKADLGKKLDIIFSFKERLKKSNTADRRINMTDVHPGNLGFHNRKLVAIDPGTFRYETEKDKAKRLSYRFAKGGRIPAYAGFSAAFSNSIKDLGSSTTRTSSLDDEYDQLHQSFMASLSPKEKEAMSRYVASGHEINQRLRGGKSIKGLGHLNSAVGRIQLPRSTTLYRGVTGEMADKVRATAIGDIISDKGFLSTSTSESIANDFSQNMLSTGSDRGSALMSIKVPKGVTAGFPGSAFGHTDQREVILPGGQQLRRLKGKGLSFGIEGYAKGGIIHTREGQAFNKDAQRAMSVGQSMKLDRFEVDPLTGEKTPRARWLAQHRMERFGNINRDKPKGYDDGGKVTTDVASNTKRTAYIKLLRQQLKEQVKVHSQKSKGLPTEAQQIRASFMEGAAPSLKHIKGLDPSDSTQPWNQVASTTDVDAFYRFAAEMNKKHGLNLDPSAAFSKVTGKAGEIKHASDVATVSQMVSGNGSSLQDWARSTVISGEGPDSVANAEKLVAETVRKAKISEEEQEAAITVAKLTAKEMNAEFAKETKEIKAKRMGDLNRHPLVHDNDKNDKAVRSRISRIDPDIYTIDDTRNSHVGRKSTTSAVDRHLSPIDELIEQESLGVGQGTAMAPRRLDEVVNQPMVSSSNDIPVKGGMGLGSRLGKKPLSAEGLRPVATPTIKEVSVPKPLPHRSYMGITGPSSLARLSGGSTTIGQGGVGTVSDPTSKYYRTSTPDNFAFSSPITGSPTIQDAVVEPQVKAIPDNPTRSKERTHTRAMMDELNARESKRPSSTGGAGRPPRRPRTASGAGDAPLGSGGGSIEKLLREILGAIKGSGKAAAKTADAVVKTAKQSNDIITQKMLPAPSATRLPGNRTFEGTEGNYLFSPSVRRRRSSNAIPVSNQIVPHVTEDNKQKMEALWYKINPDGVVPMHTGNTDQPFTSHMTQQRFTREQGIPTQFSPSAIKKNAFINDEEFLSLIHKGKTAKRPIASKLASLFESNVIRGGLSQKINSEIPYDLGDIKPAKGVLRGGSATGHNYYDKSSGTITSYRNDFGKDPIMWGFEPHPSKPAGKSQYGLEGIYSDADNAATAKGGRKGGLPSDHSMHSVASALRTEYLARLKTIRPELQGQDAVNEADRFTDRRINRGGTKSIGRSLDSLIRQNLSETKIGQQGSREAIDRAVENRKAAYEVPSGQRARIERFHRANLIETRNYGQDRLERATQALTDRDIRKGNLEPTNELSTKDRFKGYYSGLAKKNIVPNGLGLGNIREKAQGLGNRLSSFPVAIAASYAPTAIEALTGTMERPHGSRENVKTGRAIGGAFQSAAIGAQMGSIAGPEGAVVGAVLGGLVGFTSSLKSAQNEIDALKFSESFSKLQNAVEGVASGMLELKPNLGRVHSAISLQLDESTRQVAAEGGGGNWYERNIKPYYPLIDPGIDEAMSSSPTDGFRNAAVLRQKKAADLFGPMMPQLQQIGDRIASDVKTTDLTTGGKAARAAAFESQGGREIAETLAYVNKIPVQQVVEGFDKLIVTTNKERLQQEASFKRDNLVNIQTLKFTRLNQAVDAAAVAILGLQHSSDTISALFEGQATTSRVTGFGEAAGNIGGIDSSAFTGSLNFIQNSLGKGGSPIAGELNTTLSEVDRMMRDLPELITHAVSTGGFNEESIAGDVSHAFTGFSPGARKRLDAATEGIDTKDLLRKSVEDPEKLSKDLISGAFGELPKVVETLAKQLQDGFNKQAEGYTRSIAMQSTIGDTTDRGSAQTLASAKAHANIRAAGSGLSADRYISLEQLRKPYSDRQRRLAGDDGFNPENIARRALEASRGVEAQRAIMNSSTSSRGEKDAASLESARLVGEANNLQQALKNLADTSTETAAIQEKLNKVEKEREGQFSFTEKLLTSDASGMRQINRNANLSDIAVSQGSFQGFNSREISGVLEHLRSLSDVKLPGYGNRTGGETAEGLLNNARYVGFAENGMAANVDSKRAGLLGEQGRVEDKGTLALTALAGVQSQLNTDFLANLKTTNDVFISKMDQLIAKASLTDAESEVNRSSVNRGKVEKQAVNAFELDNRFGGDGVSRARTMLASPELASLKTTLDELDKIETGLRGGATDKLKSKFTAANGGDASLYGRMIPSQIDFSKSGAKEKFDKMSRDVELSASDIGRGTGLDGEVVRNEVVPAFLTEMSKALKSQTAFSVGPAMAEAIGKGVNTRTGILRSQETDLTKTISGKNFGQDNPDKATEDKVRGIARDSSRLTQVLKNVGTAETDGDVVKLDILSRQQDEEARRKRDRALEEAKAAGLPEYKAMGGSIFKAKGTDTVPAMLTPDEYVVNAKAARKNRGLLDQINFGRMGDPPVKGAGDDTKNFSASNINFPVKDASTVEEKVTYRDKGGLINKAKFYGKGLYDSVFTGVQSMGELAADYPFNDMLQMATDGVSHGLSDVEKEQNRIAGGISKFQYDVDTFGTSVDAANYADKNRFDVMSNQVASIPKWKGSGDAFIAESKDIDAYSRMGRLFGPSSTAPGITSPTTRDTSYTDRLIEQSKALRDSISMGKTPSLNNTVTGNTTSKKPNMSDILAADALRVQANNKRNREMIDAQSYRDDKRLVRADDHYNEVMSRPKYKAGYNYEQYLGELSSGFRPEPTLGILGDPSDASLYGSRSYAGEHAQYVTNLNKQVKARKAKRNRLLASRSTTLDPSDYRSMPSEPVRKRKPYSNGSKANSAMGRLMGTGATPEYRANGGMIPKGTDTIPAMLTKGEFVVNAPAASRNANVLRTMNNRSPIYRSSGGPVGRESNSGDGGPPDRSSNSIDTTSFSKAIDGFKVPVDQLASTTKGFADAMSTFSSAATQLSDSLRPFNDAAIQLSRALSTVSIPSVIQVQTRMQMDINVMGGAALAAIKGEIANEAVSQITERLPEMVRRMVTEMPA